eukprot:6188007-Pleurochrysis_carterae.AAC.1
MSEMLSPSCLLPMPSQVLCSRSAQPWLSASPRGHCPHLYSQTDFLLLLVSKALSPQSRTRWHAGAGYLQPFRMSAPS